MKYLILFPLLFLTGCATYTPTQEVTNFNVEIEFDNASQFGNYGGYADWSTNCKLYIPKDINQYNMHITGHELYHCIFGNYHELGE